MHRSLVSAAVGMVLLTLSLANCTLVAHDEDISKHPFAGIVSVTLAADIGDVEWLSAVPRPNRISDNGKSPLPI